MKAKNKSRKKRSKLNSDRSRERAQIDSRGGFPAQSSSKSKKERKIPKLKDHRQRRRRADRDESGAQLNIDRSTDQSHPLDSPKIKMDFSVRITPFHMKNSQRRRRRHRKNPIHNIFNPKNQKKRQHRKRAKNAQDDDLSTESKLFDSLSTSHPFN